MFDGSQGSSRNLFVYCYLQTMKASVKHQAEDIQLGYLTYVQLPTGGSVGGLLIVDQRARPIEFHCTAPVTPSKTQQILYGTTLRPAVLCDQIGKSLVNQVSSSPHLILTDEPLALTLRQTLGVPFALFVDRESFGDGSFPCDNENWTYEHSDCSLTVAADSVDDRRLVNDTLPKLEGNWELSEPIDRIREAVREAHRAAA